MPKGVKLSGADKEKVKAVLYINPEASNRELSRRTGIPRQTIDTMITDLKSSDEFDHYRQIQKEQFIQEAWAVVRKATLLADRRFSRALDDETALDKFLDMLMRDDVSQSDKKAIYSRIKDLQMTSIRDIAIALGTLYDKQALASGEPTQIAESRKTMSELVKETESKLAELKTLVNE